MHRKNLKDLSAEDKQTLARLIQQYVTPAVVSEHREAMASGVHNSPEGFLSFHRNYIAGLERYLQRRGFEKWVPLPQWNPADPIPEEFNIPNTGLGRLRNLNPNISFSPRFDPPNLGIFHSNEELGMALIGPHNRVHRTVGGVMNDLGRAPEAPIFWPWHSFIEDIWWNWQQIPRL